MIKEFLLRHKKKARSYEQIKHAPKPLKVLRPSMPKITSSGVFTPPAMKVGSLLAGRYEMKYFVSETQAQIIEHMIRHYVQLDQYCKGRPGSTYPLASAYLDSHDLCLCRESLDGHKNRFKLRIRRYSDDPLSPSFFEIKRRMNNIIIKDRACVDHMESPGLLLSSELLDRTDDKCREVLSQFQLYTGSISARPVVHVRYDRQAYEGLVDKRIRITFDRKLAFKMSEASKVVLNEGQWQFYPMEGVILEIKFTGYYPAWLSSVSRRLELQRQSISKYARSIQHACELRFCASQTPRQRLEYETV